MIPSPRLLPETGNGNIRDCGESVVSNKSSATHPPDRPTNNPEPNSKWHNPPASTPASIARTMAPLPVIASIRGPMDSTNSALSPACHHDPCNNP